MLKYNINAFKSRSSHLCEIFCLFQLFTSIENSVLILKLKNLKITLRTLHNPFFFFLISVTKYVYIYINYKTTTTSSSSTTTTTNIIIKYLKSFFSYCILNPESHCSALLRSYTGRPHRNTASTHFQT